MECFVCGYDKDLAPVNDPKTGKPLWYECERGRHVTERNCKDCKNKFLHPTNIFCDACMRKPKSRRNMKRPPRKAPRRDKRRERRE